MHFLEDLLCKKPLAKLRAALLLFGTGGWLAVKIGKALTKQTCC